MKQISPGSTVHKIFFVIFAGVLLKLEKVGQTQFQVSIHAHPCHLLCSNRQQENKQTGPFCLEFN